jgi:hypothetical protein
MDLSWIAGWTLDRQQDVHPAVRIKAVVTDPQDPNLGATSKDVAFF